MRLCDELLQGAIDLHQHAAPSLFERITDDIGLATEARARGMRAVLLKAHEQDTTGRAALVRRQVLEHPEYRRLRQSIIDFLENHAHKAAWGS